MVAGGRGWASKAANLHGAPCPAGIVATLTTDAERYLREFHDRVAGATPRGIGRARSAGGLNSYERLLAGIALDGAAVLDLACGDGTLLELVARHSPRALFGVDLSPVEVDRARARLGPGVDIRCERASELSLLRASIDVVLCHMALMLMSPIEQVLDRVADVLRSGGTFG